MPPCPFPWKIGPFLPSAAARVVRDPRTITYTRLPKNNNQLLGITHTHTHIYIYINKHTYMLYTFISIYKRTLPHQASGPAKSLFSSSSLQQVVLRPDLSPIPKECLPPHLPARMLPSHQICWMEGFHRENFII